MSHDRHTSESVTQDSKDTDDAADHDDSAENGAIEYQRTPIVVRLGAAMLLLVIIFGFAGMFWIEYWEPLVRFDAESIRVDDADGADSPGRLSSRGILTALKDEARIGVKGGGSLWLAKDAQVTISPAEHMTEAGIVTGIVEAYRSRSDREFSLRAVDLRVWPGPGSGGIRFLDRNRVVFGTPLKLSAGQQSSSGEINLRVERMSKESIEFDVEAWGVRLRLAGESEIELRQSDGEEAQCEVVLHRGRAELLQSGDRPWESLQIGHTLDLPGGRRLITTKAE